MITPIGAVELVVGLKAPKSRFHVLSEFFSSQVQYSLKTGRPFPRPVARARPLTRSGGLFANHSDAHHLLRAR